MQLQQGLAQALANWVLLFFVRYECPTFQRQLEAIEQRNHAI
jgi:hypothetical protein